MKKIRFNDPKRTKELQEDMRDYGRALTYIGLFIFGFVVLALILTYFGIT